MAGSFQRMPRLVPPADQANGAVVHAVDGGLRRQLLGPDAVPGRRPPSLPPGVLRGRRAGVLPVAQRDAQPRGRPSRRSRAVAVGAVPPPAGLGPPDVTCAPSSRLPMRHWRLRFLFFCFFFLEDVWKDGGRALFISRPLATWMEVFQGQASRLESAFATAAAVNEALSRGGRREENSAASVTFGQRS